MASRKRLQRSDSLPDPCAAGCSTEHYQNLAMCRYRRQRTSPVSDHSGELPSESTASFASLSSYDTPISMSASASTDVTADGSTSDEFYDVAASSDHSSSPSASGETIPDNIQSEEDHCSNDDNAAPPGYIDLGDPIHACRFCGALFWYEERCKSSSRQGFPVYNRCCHEGRVSLPPFKEAATLLQVLLDPENSQDFRHYQAPCFFVVRLHKLYEIHLPMGFANERNDRPALRISCKT